MNRLSSILLCVTLSVFLQAARRPARPAAMPQLPVTLGTAGNYSVLGASTVTNTGGTLVNGNLGVSPGAAVTGFPPGVVTGGVIHAADVSAGTAQGDLTAAYINAQGRMGGMIEAGDLGGLTLTPGLYQSLGTLGITGTLTFNGQGDPNSVFIIQVASALTTATGSQIVLIGGAQAANIFWQVGSSASLGTYSLFNGTILAQASVTLATGAVLNGRALARTAAVTLDTNTIVNPGPPTLGTIPGALAVTCPAVAAQGGVAYNSLVTATGGTPPYTFSVTGTLPAGLTLNTMTGDITGSPSGAGSTAFGVGVSDSAAGRATNNCSIVTSAVAPPPATPAPSSFILVLVGLACISLYASRGRWLGMFKGN